MMTPDELWSLIAETYTVHFMMMGCGLSNDEVFTGIDPIVNAPTTDPYVFVVARKGGREFLFWVAPLPDEDDRRAFRSAFVDFSKKQPTMDRGELDWMVVTSAAYHQFPALRQGLIDKGLVPEGSGKTLLAAWTDAFEPEAKELN